MKTLTITIFSISLLLIILAFFQTPDRKIKIFMAGDSTMANKPLEDNPERGWGMMLQQFFDSSVIIENHAKNGRSTRTFISEGRWDSLINKLYPGDYVIIQFGHNDGSIEKKDRYTSPRQYRENLVKFVIETRSKKASPILCTPIMRRRFNEKNQFYDTHGVYPEIIREIADSMNVPLLEMHLESKKLIAGHGVEGSKKLFLHIDSLSYKSLPKGKTDDTHFSEFGAMKMAEIAVNEIKRLNLSLKTKLLK